MGSARRGPTFRPGKLTGANMSGAKKAHSPLHHLTWHGVAAVAIGVASAVQIRGLDVRLLLLFCGPLLIAAACTVERAPRPTRVVAWTFLAMIGVGAVVAHTPQLFPQLRGFDERLPSSQDRVLTWYCAVYLTWIFSVVPMVAFLSNLWQIRRGRPAQLSRFTCYLGLATSGIMTLCLPRIFFEVLGFWPIV